MSDSSNELPKPTASDRAHGIFKAAVAGAVPIPVVGGLVGGIAAEILGAVLTSPLERRRDAWMASVAARLAALEASDPQRFSTLSNDSTFVSVLLQATQAAMRSRHEEKTLLLRNAVVQSAWRSSIADDLQLLFVRYVDELTPTHVQLLRTFLANGDAIANVESYAALRSSVMEFVPCSEEEFRLLCNDLSNRVLLRITTSLEDFADIAQPMFLTTRDPGNVGPRVKVSEHGRRFLAFVAESSAEQDRPAA